MSDPLLRLAFVREVTPQQPRKPLGRLLVDLGLITPVELMKALHVQHRVDAQLGDILVSEGLLTERDVLDALAIQYGGDRVDLAIDPPKLQMSEALPRALCLQFGMVPWRWLGDALLLATSQPGRIDDLRDVLGDDVPYILPVVASPQQIQQHQGRLFGHDLAAEAISCVPSRFSARRLGGKTGGRSIIAALMLAFVTSATLFAPLWAIGVLMAWCVFTLCLTTGLKLAAFLSQITHNIAERQTDGIRSLPDRLPKVSVIVPLYREEDIAGALIKRLSRLTYPKCCLDVVLALEAKDTVTRDTLARTPLPHWIKVLEVPDDGSVTTKPRALNYALKFCQGSIVGVWDAEDAPEPDQIEQVVAMFDKAPADVICLQGMLDYYNSRTNWIARCFAIEYATWWRIVMPGMSRLGFVIPLGGTTLFFRKAPLEEIGGWDAHNVTEDADLGLRLARHGYRTELINTVTQEEANCRAIPWIRQRSRWLKGFLITYFVHMRHPRQLMRDLGWRRWLGVQIVFLATFSQFAALPLLWTFWAPVFGWSHPATQFLDPVWVYGLGMLFFGSEMLNLVIGMSAVSGRRHRHLLHWVITMPFYFTLGAFAAYKALFETVVSPYYWDKTQHGIAPGKEANL